MASGSKSVCTSDGIQIAERRAPFRLGLLLSSTRSRSLLESPGVVRNRSESSGVIRSRTESPGFGVFRSPIDRSTPELESIGVNSGESSARASSYTGLCFQGRLRLTTNDFDSNKADSERLQTTPDDYEWFRTTPDNAGRTYLPESIPKLS